VGGVRGVFFANLGGAWFDTPANAPAGYPSYKFATTQGEVIRPLTGYNYDALGNATPVYGAPQVITGFRLQDGRASYGIGLETFALGFPIHFDWSWRTLFNKDYENAIFAINGGSSAFRKPKFAVWIGYDF